MHALGSPNYFNHDPTCGGNVHNAAISIYGFSHERIMFDLKHTRHLALYGRNMVESIMVKEVKAFMDAVANGMRVTDIDPRASLTPPKRPATGRCARTATTRSIWPSSMNC